MHNKYIMMGSFLIYFTCSGMTHHEKEDLNKIPRIHYLTEPNVSSLQEHKKSNNPLKEEETRVFPVQFENDPNNPHVQRINLPWYLYQRNKSLSKQQSKFLEKRKNKKLPWIVGKREKKIFESLEGTPLFSVQKITKKTWKIKRARSLPGKFKKKD